MSNRTAGHSFHRVALCVLAIALPCLALTGCLKRIEVIAILPDGSASLVTQIQGDPDDVKTGDAMPTTESGWQVTDRMETDKDKKEAIERTATRKVGAGESWPISYAAPGSEIEARALWFPTQLTVESRDDGMYYHFRRVYLGRAYACVGYWHEQILETDDLKRITSQSPDAMTDADRKTLATALVAFDRAKSLALYDQAAESVTAAIPQDAILAARRAIGAVYDEESAVTKLESMLAEKDAGPEYESLETDTRELAAANMRSALERKHVAPAAIEALVAACVDARSTFEVTDDIGDEDWLVKMVMPGRIVEHNCFEHDEGTPVDLNQLAKDAEPEFQPLIAELSAAGFGPGFSELDWTFDGKALYDRDVVVMATSFVPND